MPVDPSAHIAPTARVSSEANIGPGVRVGEYCVIEPDVTIGRGCTLEPYVYVKRWTSMGEENQISAGTVLGTDPLDKAFTGERSYLRIGNGNRIREHFTISRGTQPESETRIGNWNYIMTSGHIAHNCLLGDNVVLASCSLLAGYVEVQDGAFISGEVAVHQFTRIGRLAMVSGATRVPQDLPPFFLYWGERGLPRGLNRVGLKRAGFSPADINTLKKIYRILFNARLKLQDALRMIEEDAPGPLGDEITSFVRSSKRGIARPIASRHAPTDPA